MNLYAKIGRFLEDESGPTAVEYAIMLVMIIVTLIVTIQSLGNATNSAFAGTTTSIESVTP